MTNIGRRAGLVLAVLFGLGASGCTDLLVEPKSSVTGANIFTDEAAYESFLAKVYAGLALSGQQGPAGEPDIEGIDEGFGQYIRGYWQLQELPTDEAVIGWGDAGLPEMVTSQWASSNQFITAMYYRIFFQIALANEFLRETSDEALAARGHSGLVAIPQFRAEARALRALSYWHGMDLFGPIPMVTEDYEAGSAPPEQVSRAEVFTFVENELTDPAVVGQLPAVGAAEYGRLDQGAVAMILAKLYLNAEAYGVGARYADAMTQAQIVISGPYTLDPNFQDMFLADNHTSPELVFAVPFDGTRTQTWGGTTFIAHASVGGTMDPADFGIDGGWFGLRVTQQFVNLFEGGAGGPDGRADILYTDNQQLTVTSLGTFEHGFAYPKYSNVTSLGVAGSHSTHTDIDFPMFRLADALLIYAEACLRSGGGACEATALTYVNAVRQRAYGNTSGNITPVELTLDFILDERARELAWEGHRRQDLIRYGLFTGDVYLWAFKGGVATGAATPATRDLYPIPAIEIVSNPNVDQNPGY
ncbi:MAG TPA: RagB/SusD family nutrient uptake outer membrane protein [Longimicrobiales bacterium]|nr:RagB/SusD family nutrient uptake outer membrane protein [Longimicrobiales bacterium]